MTDTKNGTIALRWTHIIIFLIGQVFLIGGTYALTRYQVEDHERRLEKVEDATSGMRESREDIQRRLQKVEDKLDILILSNAKNR